MSRHAKSATRAAGRRANSWDGLIQKWVKRVLIPHEPGWVVSVKASEELKGTQYSAVTQQDQYVYRHAIVEYNPEAAPQNDIACHEVVHMLLAPLTLACERGAGAFGTAGKVLDEWRSDAEERTCEAITCALLKAYGEE